MTKIVKRAGAAGVVRAWLDGLDLVPLEGGGWAPLPADWLARHGHLVADLLAARGTDKKLGPAALLTLGPLCDALVAPRPPELARLAPFGLGNPGVTLLIDGPADADPWGVESLWSGARVVGRATGGSNLTCAIGLPGALSAMRSMRSRQSMRINHSSTGRNTSSDLQRQQCG